MRLSDFINECVTNGCAWSKGMYNEEPGYFIRPDRFNTDVHFTPQAMLANIFPKLYAHIVQEWDVIHIMRVVGYFSRVQNWNKSKKGELRGRHAGNYSIA